MTSMSMEVDNTVRQREDFQQMGTEHNHQLQLQLFLSSGPLMFSTVDIFGLLL